MCTSSPMAMGWVAKPIIWLNLRMGWPCAMGLMASLWPAGMSDDAMRCRPLRDWPRATGLRATTTSSPAPSLRVWVLNLSYLFVFPLRLAKLWQYWYDHTLLHLTDKRIVLLPNDWDRLKLCVEERSVRIAPARPSLYGIWFSRPMKDQIRGCRLGCWLVWWIELF